MKKIESPFTWSVYVGQLAVLFHIQPPDEFGRPHARMVYELVAPDDATTFSTFQEAMTMAMENDVKDFLVRQSQRQEAA